jgi:hypothetical protein
MRTNPLLIGLSFLAVSIPTDALRTPVKRSLAKRALGSALSRTKLGHDVSKSQVVNAADNDNDNEESLACVFLLMVLGLVG